MIIEMLTGLSLIMVFILVLMAIQMYKLMPAINVLYTNVVRGMSLYIVYGLSMGALLITGVGSTNALAAWQGQVLPMLYELFLYFQGKNWSMTHVFK
ncbi:MAG: hypothetical protein [Bacteriophage sp.]|nr:MAG: hypothetical protein [Bacteriophage sp.]